MLISYVFLTRQYLLLVIRLTVVLHVKTIVTAHNLWPTNDNFLSSLHVSLCFYFM